VMVGGEELVGTGDRLDFEQFADAPEFAFGVGAEVLVSHPQPPGLRQGCKQLLGLAAAPVPVARGDADAGASDALGLTSVFWITVFAVALAILVSETTSNTASAAVVVPIVIPIAVAAGVDPFVPALAATFAASFGFMLPVSTPQNAVVYGSGTVPITTMIRTGASFDVIGAILIVTLLPVAASMIGLV